MRILGEIPHAIYKITILEMNKKTVLQIEDVDVVQLYRFREGELNNYNDVRDLNDTFYNNVADIFNQMRANKVDNTPKLKPIQEDFPEII